MHAAGDILRAKLSVILRQGEYLMPAEFDRPGFMYADVPGLRRDHALVWTEKRVDYDGIGLRPAGKEEDVRLRGAACGADFLPRGFRIRVKPIACALAGIDLGKTPQEFRVRALHIVGREGQSALYVHFLHPLWSDFFSGLLYRAAPQIASE